MSYKPESIRIKLLSDTTFGCGEGTPGVVDVEIEHDQYGLPMLGGKALRGLLRDSWLTMEGQFEELSEAAVHIFGAPGDVDERSILRIGDARIEENTRQWFISAVEREHHPISPVSILDALTTIRYQTSEDRITGAPAHKTLRSVRVALRGLELVSPLSWLRQPTQEELQCLALALLATRHAGLNRSRGRGHLKMTLEGDLEKTRELAGGRRQ